ncbi:hypothetical protein HMPREF3038_01402 [Akkermansia sp. KLE1797]|nr:hypothetical protein HMPREF3038_01402 [Akkermansia sp. KLE1797]KXU55579.1 hypothetical protein HMPREF3039_00312 [Akkermansia sp. KLE1798]KZA03386.1 hypothetical protein HMPREF1326_02925 [Akkermansia sp. KLE1605]
MFPIIFITFLLRKERQRNYGSNMTRKIPHPHLNRKHVLHEFRLPAVFSAGALRRIKLRRV